jgi:hypothetical protein
MSTFLLPKGLCRKLDNIFKNFWWGFPLIKVRNPYLKSWDSLCSLKVYGVFGFRKMEDVNLVLILKFGWKLHSNSDSMWVSQLKGKYLLSSSFLSPLPHSSLSWLRKGILSSQFVISQGSCHRVHLYTSIPIWNSPWIPSIPSFSPSYNSFSLPNSSKLVVSDLINLNATWNTPILFALFDIHSVRKIQKIIINFSPSSDFL